MSPEELLAYRQRQAKEAGPLTGPIAKGQRVPASHWNSLEAREQAARDARDDAARRARHESIGGDATVSRGMARALATCKPAAEPMPWGHDGLGSSCPASSVAGLALPPRPTRAFAPDGERVRVSEAGGGSTESVRVMSKAARVAGAQAAARREHAERRLARVRAAGLSCRARADWLVRFCIGLARHARKLAVTRPVSAPVAVAVASVPVARVPVATAPLAEPVDLSMEQVRRLAFPVSVAPVPVREPVRASRALPGGFGGMVAGDVEHELVGSTVLNSLRPEWGLGRVRSVEGGRVWVAFPGRGSVRLLRAVLVYR